MYFACKVSVHEQLYSLRYSRFWKFLQLILYKIFWINLENLLHTISTSCIVHFECLRGLFIFGQLVHHHHIAIVKSKAVVCFDASHGLNSHSWEVISLFHQLSCMSFDGFNHSYQSFTISRWLVAFFWPLMYSILGVSKPTITHTVAMVWSENAQSYRYLYDN